MTPGILMHPRRKLIEAESDYVVPIMDDDETMTHMDRRKLWPVALVVVLVPALIAWLVLR